MHTLLAAVKYFPSGYSNEVVVKGAIISFRHAIPLGMVGNSTTLLIIKTVITQWKKWLSKSKL